MADIQPVVKLEEPPASKEPPSGSTPSQWAKPAYATRKNALKYSGGAAGGGAGDSVRVKLEDVSMKRPQEIELETGPRQKRKLDPVTIQGCIDARTCLACA